MNSQTGFHTLSRRTKRGNKDGEQIDVASGWWDLARFRVGEAESGVTRVTRECYNWFL